MRLRPQKHFVQAYNLVYSRQKLEKVIPPRWEARCAIHYRDLIHEVLAAGCRLVAREGRLFVTPPGLLPARLRPALEACKAELIAWLAAAPADEARIDAMATFFADHPDAPDCFLIRSTDGTLLGCASSVELAEWDRAKRRTLKAPCASEVIPESVPVYGVPTHRKAKPLKERGRKGATR